MNILVWHWGRRGAGPLFAARLASALGDLPGVKARLSMAAGAEILAGANAPICSWREPTYDNWLGFIIQRMGGPLLANRTRQRIRVARPDVAVCAMPALLDSRMVAGLRASQIPYAVIVHDAKAHPGEALKFRALGQTHLLRQAGCLFTLTGHVEAELRRQGFGRAGQPIVKLWHPPIGFGAPPGPRAAGPVRWLYFGRLLPYKGLDLLADALDMIGPVLGFELRVCGDGPPSAALTRLAARPGVSVERRWFADEELPGLLAWADALVLPYREASQSGVAALAMAAGRHVLATNVGGLAEQLGGLVLAQLCPPQPAAIANGLIEMTAQRAGRAGAAAAPVDAAANWRDMAVRMAGSLAEMLPSSGAGFEHIRRAPSAIVTPRSGVPPV